MKKNIKRIKREKYTGIYGDLSGIYGDLKG